MGCTSALRVNCRLWCLLNTVRHRMHLSIRRFLRTNGGHEPASGKFPMCSGHALVSWIFASARRWRSLRDYRSNISVCLRLSAVFDWLNAQRHFARILRVFSMRLLVSRVRADPSVETARKILRFACVEVRFRIAQVCSLLQRSFSPLRVTGDA